MHIHYLSCSTIITTSSTLISSSAHSVHVMKMAEAFTGLDHCVTLHAFPGSGETTEDVFSYYDVRQDRHFNLERHNQNKIWMCRFLNQLSDWLPALRIRGLSYLIYAFAALKIENKADLLFSCNMAWLFPFRHTFPFIYETHDVPPTFVHRYLTNKLVHAKNCKGFVVISEKLKEAYLEIFPDIGNKIIVAPGAANDPKGADKVIENTLKRPVKTIGYVGGLYQGRGIDVIIAVAKALPDYQFHIVGGGADLAEEISGASCPANMVCHGHRPHKEVKNFYKTFDIVLAPYQRNKVAEYGNTGDTSKYMSPMKIFEYMAWGLPMVCSDLPVLKEVLSDKYNSVLVPPDQPEAWVNAIIQISSDSKLRHYLAQNARRNFLETYTRQARARFILDRINRPT